MMSFGRLCGSESSPTHIHYTIHQMGILINCLFPTSAEWKGLREQKWNSEQPLLFASIILQKKHGTFRDHDIHQRIEQRLQHWMKGDFIGLFNRYH